MISGLYPAADWRLRRLIQEFVCRTDDTLVLWTYHHKNVTQSERRLSVAKLAFDSRGCCVLRSLRDAQEKAPPIEEVTMLVVPQTESPSQCECRQSQGSQETGENMTFGVNYPVSVPS